MRAPALGSEVPGRVHPLIQDADDVQVVGTKNEEDRMTADRIADVAFADLAPGAPSAWIRVDALDRHLDLAEVLLRLTGVPSLSPIWNRAG